ncbi:hypothetical protein NX794_03975 [Streptomyces sp. LP11]|uniref:Uncharacterized protein n=1 Tax=Streptomyces pyxinicus TaxID=2970331 RepID=A0ABT2AVW5_9ACTN|nr:hypothetical protein [Streptomyces sp. LP11]MCS0600392.1 hypothetical protein [Streptomyces sp. LP11]
MHHHGYLWHGPKSRFDQDALRRPPHPQPPPAESPPELIQRYREVASAFPASELPPLETAYWLVKPPSLVRGTWTEPQEAAAWLSAQLGQYAHRFAVARQRDASHRAALVTSAEQRMTAGQDVSLGFYLERPAYLSVALVTCSPNRGRPQLTCPTVPASAPAP